MKKLMLLSLFIVQCLNISATQTNNYGHLALGVAGLSTAGVLAFSYLYKEHTDEARQKTAVFSENADTFEQDLAAQKAEIDSIENVQRPALNECLGIVRKIEAEHHYHEHPKNNRNQFLGLLRSRATTVRVFDIAPEITAIENHDRDTAGFEPCNCESHSAHHSRYGLPLTADPRPSCDKLTPPVAHIKTKITTAQASFTASLNKAQTRHAQLLKVKPAFDDIASKKKQAKTAKRYAFGCGALGLASLACYFWNK